MKVSCLNRRKHRGHEDRSRYGAYRDSCCRYERQDSWEVSKFTKEDLLTPLEGVEGVASVTSMGMVDDDVQIVLSQKKIDKINDEIASAISAQTGEASSQIKSGIGAAKDGKSKVEAGKKAITEGQQKAAKTACCCQITAHLKQRTAQGTQGERAAAETAWESYSSSDPIVKSQAEAQMKVIGMTPDRLKETVAQLETVDDQIKAVDAAIADLDEKSSTATFSLGTKYSDLSAAESTIDSTVNQLQSALSQVQDSEKAALASADMTGVLTMDNIPAHPYVYNFSMPAGYITDGKAELLVNVGDKIKDKKEMSRLSIRSRYRWRG
ncbi:MAG: hypothetical protein V8Q42_13625, partial [Anaerovoracaceae bacterium]